LEIDKINIQGRVKTLFLIMDKGPQGKESLCVRKGSQPKVKDNDLTTEAGTLVDPVLHSYVWMIIGISYLLADILC
jgi:hypothetical protein